MNQKNHSRKGTSKIETHTEHDLCYSSALPYLIKQKRKVNELNIKCDTSKQT